MGANLSTPQAVDISKDVISPTDRTAEMVLGLLWAVALYGIGIIFTTLALVDRWKGPTDKNRVGFLGVLLCMLVATAWPLVLIALAVTSALR